MGSRLEQILFNFQLEGELLGIRPYGSGHINTTYLVQSQKEEGGPKNFILQNINRHVFKEPEKVMANIERITAFLKQKITQEGGDPERETLTLVSTKSGESFYKTAAGEYWRLYLYIEGARSYEKVHDPHVYYEVGHTYGRFQSMLADFPADKLFETIPNFHHTGKRLSAFEASVAEDKFYRAQSVSEEIRFIRNRAPTAPVLTNLLEAGQIPLRITHNDTKIDNVLIDTQTGKGICIIDLDTVMPGIAMFDFADTVRTGANLAAEDEPDTDRVEFGLDVYEQLAHGFLDANRQNMTTIEIDHLAFAARLITFEQAVRFLTDYLKGDVYYKTDYPLHNLARCGTQIRLLQLMEANQLLMAEIIEKYRN